MADLPSLVFPKQMSRFKAVVNLQEVVGDMNDRIPMLTAQAPVEARWQAEYLVTALLKHDVREGVDALVGSLRTMTEVLALVGIAALAVWVVTRKRRRGKPETP